MKKCRVTVLRRCMFPDLIEEYAKDGVMPACHAFREGDVYDFDWDTYAMQKIPQGFCVFAWQTLSPFICAALSAGIVLDGDWVKDPKEMVICCLDGLRPVVFKVEAYEE